MKNPRNPTRPSVRGPRIQAVLPGGFVRTTIFDLVNALDEIAETEEEAIAVLAAMLREGRVHLADQDQADAA